jgi:hypothetical protein
MSSSILDASADLLLAMRDADSGLFSSTTSIVGGSYRSQYDQPAAHRYSTVALLGLQRFLSASGAQREYAQILDSFTQRHWERVERPGDVAVLAQVLAASDHALLPQVLGRLRAFANNPALLRTLTIQEMAQMLSALCEIFVATGSAEAQAMAESVRTSMSRHFCSDDHLFPRHSLEWYRSRFVSFGAITYYLRSMYDSATHLGHASDGEAYADGVRHLLRVQGPSGEWPWFFDRQAGRVLDWYEVFSVHQHAMAFLWLFPAVDKGIDGAREAVVRSYEWIMGKNQLGTSMLVRDPYFIYRSHRRTQAVPAARRYARAVLGVSTGRNAKLIEPVAIEVNKECRSYEMGWLLYVWVGRSGFPGFTLT